MLPTNRAGPARLVIPHDGSRLVREGALVDDGVDGEQVVDGGGGLELLDGLLVRQDGHEALHVLEVLVLVRGAQREEDLRVVLGIVGLTEVDGLVATHEADAGAVAALGVLGGVGHGHAGDEDDVGAVLLDVLDDDVGVDRLDQALGLEGLAALAQSVPPAQRALGEGVTLLLPSVDVSNVANAVLPLL